MEMPKLFMDHKDNSSGQQLTSFFPLFQEGTGCELDGNNLVTLRPPFFPGPSLLLHCLLTGACTTREGHQGRWKDDRQEQAAAATSAGNLAYSAAPLGSQN